MVPRNSLFLEQYYTLSDGKHNKNAIYIAHEYLTHITIAHPEKSYMQTA